MMLNRIAVVLLLAFIVAAPKSVAQDTTLADVSAEQSSEVHSLRSVEQEVDQLKERVFRSKATLQLLRELVVEGASLGSRVVLWYQNDLSAAYKVESVQYFLDGESVYSRIDPGGSFASEKEIQIAERSSSPGMHTLQVQAVLRGNGYGVFSYLRTYTFNVQSNYSFQVEDGQITVVRAILDDQGGLLRSFVDRPTVAYEERFEALRVD